eukprot:403336227
MEIESAEDTFFQNQNPKQSSKNAQNLEDSAQQSTDDLFEDDLVFEVDDLTSVSNQKYIFDKVLEQRWLKTSEVFDFLNNIEYLMNLGYQLQTHKHLERPRSGQFYIFSTQQKSIWRKDLHSYVTRKGHTNAVREDQVKLKLNGKEFAICAYTIGCGVIQNSSSYQTPESFKRRAYWLIDNPKYVLVHYLDESLKFIRQQQFLRSINNQAISKSDQCVGSKQENQDFQNNMQIEFSDFKFSTADPDAIQSNTTLFNNSNDSRSFEGGVIMENVFEDNLSQLTPSSIKFSQFNAYHNVESQDKQIQRPNFSTQKHASHQETLFHSSQTRSNQDQHQSEQNIDAQIERLMNLKRQQQMNTNSNFSSNANNLNDFFNVSGFQSSNYQQNNFTNSYSVPDTIINNPIAKDTQPQSQPSLTQQNDLIDNILAPGEIVNQTSFFSNQEDINSLQSQILGMQLKLSQLEANFQTQQSFEIQHLYKKGFQKELNFNQHEQIKNKQISQQPSMIKLEMPRVAFSNTNIEIIDFSPEWDYTTGGSKLLVCVKPSSAFENLPDYIEKNLELSFGDVLVPIKFLQPGVFKCNAPPHEAGFVNLHLMYEGKILTVSQNENQSSNSFEYKQQIPKTLKKKRIRNTQANDQMLDGDTREFKVRIVERLTYLEQRINNQTQKGDDAHNSFNHSITSNIEGQFKNFDNEMLETLNQEFTIRVIEKFLIKMKAELPDEERIRLLNEHDQYGGTLIHYITGLNYYKLIPILHEFGADINMRTKKTNLSPLMIAISKGHEKSVKKLMREGAVFWNEDTNADFQFDGASPLDQDRERSYGGSIYDHESDDYSELDDEIYQSSKRLSSQNSLIRDDDGALELALQNKHHSILEMLLRDYTLKCALKDDQNLNNDYRQNYYSNQDSNQINGTQFSLNLDRLNDQSAGISLKRKPEQNQRSQNNLSQEPGYKFIPKSLGVQQEHIPKVQKIQKCVRAWLLKRQNQDIEHATNILHSSISSNMMSNRRHNTTIDDERAAIIIQRTVRAWLKQNFDQIDKHQLIM